MRGAGETREKNGRAWRALIHSPGETIGEPRKFGKSSAAGERAAAGMD